MSNSNRKIFSIGILMFVLIFVLTSLSFSIPPQDKQSFVIGEDEGIFYITRVKEGPDGNIYIYDPRTAFISVFSPEGRFMRKMGGKGQGPGEIQRVTDLDFNFTYDGKYLYFTEFFSGHRWITFMELSGKFHRVLKLKVDKNYAIVNSLQLKDGSFLAHAAFPCDTAKRDDYYVYRCPDALIKIDKKGAIEWEILRKTRLERISLISNGADIGIPFVPGYWWALRDEKEILLSRGTGKNIGIYDFKGKLTGSIAAHLPDPRPVTAQDLDRWRRERFENARNKDWMARWGRVAKKYKTSVHVNKPILMGMRLTPENNLLVAVRAGTRTDPDGWEYRLLDRKGKLLLTLPGNRKGLKITAHFIFSRITDEDDNNVLQVLKRKPGQGEKKSLAGILE